MSERALLPRLARWGAALAVATLAGCATVPPPGGGFAFGVMGDAGYNAREEVVVVEMLERIGREDLAFVVHVGDFLGGVDCTDQLFERRRREFDASAHPFIYTPGDNEWTDCRQRRRGGHDPQERLAKLRQLFFADRLSLGRRRIETLAQDACVEASPPGCGCNAHPENRAWSRSGVRFVTLNVPGSENNTGYGAGDAEARCRDEANKRWLEESVRAVEDPGMRALVILLQANPWDSMRDVYRPLLRQVEAAARRLRKPVLFVHGDSHGQRVDTPFADIVGTVVPGLVRLETFGSPFIGWVKVTVNPRDPQVFRFDPRLHAIVPPG